MSDSPLSLSLSLSLFLSLGVYFPSLVKECVFLFFFFFFFFFLLCQRRHARRGFREEETIASRYSRLVTIVKQASRRFWKLFPAGHQREEKFLATGGRDDAIYEERRGMSSAPGGRPFCQPDLCSKYLQGEPPSCVHPLLLMDWTATRFPAPFCPVTRRFSPHRPVYR